MNTQTLAKRIAYTKAWKKRNKEKVSEYNKLWRIKHKQERLVYEKNYRENNKNSIAIALQTWGASNKHKRNKITNDYKSSKINATPAWTSKLDVEMWYEVAKILSNSGVKYHVDHIIPLKNKMVCGLNVETNLQVIADWKNKSKGNKYVVQ